MDIDNALVARGTNYDEAVAIVWFRVASINRTLCSDLSDRHTSSGAVATMPSMTKAPDLNQDDPLS